MKPRHPPHGKNVEQIRSEMLCRPVPHTRAGDHRTQLRPDAAWHPKVKKPSKCDPAASTVVYVVGRDDDTLVKIGATSSLKKRMQNLSRDGHGEMFIHFWAEMCRADAFAVEAAAKRALQDAGFADGRKEWMQAPPEYVARAIVNAAHDVGVRIRASAGMPVVAEEPTEVLEILAEPLHWRDRKGRAPREEYAPQAHSVWRSTGY